MHNLLDLKVTAAIVDKETPEYNQNQEYSNLSYGPTPQVISEQTRQKAATSQHLSVSMEDIDFLDNTILQCELSLIQRHLQIELTSLFTKGPKS